MGRRIGFRLNNEDEEVDVTTETPSEPVQAVEAEVTDLHTDIVRAINQLINAMSRYNGVISEITVNVNANGKHKTNIKY